MDMLQTAIVILPFVLLVSPQVPRVFAGIAAAAAGITVLSMIAMALIKSLRPRRNRQKTRVIKYYVKGRSRKKGTMRILSVEKAA